MVATSIHSVNSYLLVPPREALSYPTDMRPKNIRRSNLELLVKEFGSIAEVARKAGTSEKYLSQILGKRVQRKTERGIGDTVAIKLETGCRKPIGWIDIYHPQATDASEHVVKECKADAYLPPANLTDEEALILKAFNAFSQEFRDSWIATANDYLRKHSTFGKNAAA